MTDRSDQLDRGATVSSRDHLQPPHRFQRLDHVAVVVADADQALGYYRSVLGMEVFADERLNHLGVRLVYLDMGNTMLQLVEPFGPGPVWDHFQTNGEGLHHICLTVDDIPTTLARLDGEDDARIFQGGRSKRACFLQARPNKVIVELTESSQRSLE